MNPPSIHSLRRAVTLAAAAAAGMAGAATPVFAAPAGDGTSNTIQLSVTSVTLDQAHHRVLVSGPAQDRLVPGMHLVTAEIITPVETYTLNNTMISGFASNRLALNYAQINIEYALPKPCRPSIDACLIESDGISPPAYLGPA